MRERRARQVMRNARKSEKQLRRFLERQSAGLSAEEMQAFTSEALARAEEWQAESETADPYIAQVSLGLLKLGRRRASPGEGR